MDATLRNAGVLQRRSAQSLGHQVFPSLESQPVEARTIRPRISRRRQESRSENLVSISHSQQRLSKGDLGVGKDGAAAVVSDRNQRPSENPAHTATSPRITLAAILPKAIMGCPIRRSSRVFQPKVEKVVKLPRKPVKTANWIASENHSFCSKRVNSQPKRKHPRTFTSKIPQGKWEFTPHFASTQLCSPQRESAPRAPPAQRQAIDFSIDARASN